MLRVAVIGGINIDVLALVDRQPDDDHPAVIHAVADLPGGKGANQAAAAARLGAEVRLLGAVGDDDDGVRVVRDLTAAGVDCRAVRISRSAPTGRVVGTVTREGTKRTAALGGANLRLTADHVAGFEAAIVGADVVICQLEPPPETVRVALEVAAAAGVPALLDLAPAQGPLRELFPLARWVTGNRGEANAATGVTVEDRDTAREAATVIRAHGPSTAGVTVNAAGQLVAWSGGEAWNEPDRSVPIVDTAGAGDAFAATLAVALGEGLDLPDAAALASRASTLACRALGAQAALPTREELEWS
ncbi:MAG TPA: PfkB family carbohydrate kinase [Acidimicrobiales bacterium]|nr:PfkB family carbohydrate kinase [Acidimicrobiales bacterium]